MASFDITTLTAGASWALAIGTLLILYWQTRQAQRLNSANAVLELRQQFDSPRMRRARHHLSSRLINNQHEDITSVEVATFFELVGALTHRRVLDEDLIWEAFGTWIVNYYTAMRRPVDLIGRARTSLQDPLVFHEFEWLSDRIREIDQRMLGAAHAEVVESPEETRTILKRESTLDLEVS
ncbi:MAG: DUF4760 domain-containing protein [Thermoplasmata archaeon]|nr:DUF4760 domain-containing protein [Thermoplasmata archaeon]